MVLLAESGWSFGETGYGPDKKAQLRMDIDAYRKREGLEPVDWEEAEQTFKRLRYEIAFTEYAIGLAKEYADNQYYSDFDEPLFDIRDRIDRLARRASDVLKVTAF
jgi:hypothetical protein